MESGRCERISHRGHGFRIKPTELPGWVSGYQALDLARHSAEEVKEEVAAIAARIKANKQTAMLVAGLALAALFLK